MRYLISIAFSFIFGIALAQQPIITNLSKTSGTVNETVLISGSGFPTNIADVQVNFGAGVASVSSASATLLEVLVPPTATYGPITVLNKTTGLSGISRQSFLLSFGGDGYETAQLDAQVNFETNRTQTYDLCNCDFDGDGKVDVAMSNNEDENISVFRNTSTLTTTTFALTNILNGNFTTDTDCEDMNGDGKPDLVFSNNLATGSQDIFVFRNTSTPGTITIDTKDFSTKLPTLDGNNRNARSILIADIDGDGLKDMVVSNDSDESIFIYLNTTASTGGVITFAAPVQITIPGLISTGLMASGDFNGDGLTDLITTRFDPFGQGNSDLYVLRNISSDGSPAFSAPVTTSVSLSSVSLAISDFNNDGLVDIAVSDRLSNEIHIVPNSSSNTSLSFGTSQVISTSTPWGITTGDMDGDGLSDIVSASVSGAINVFTNISSGSISFGSEASYSLNSNARYIQVADLNNDGKPDFSFSSNSLQGQPGQLGVVINRNCFLPAVTPTGLTFCLNTPFTLSTYNSIETSYTWDLVGGNGTVTPNGNEATFSITSGTSATISVTITSNDGSCSGASQNTFEQNFTISPGSPPAQPTVTSNSPVCAGDDLILEGPASFTNYFWVLPDGTERMESTNQLIITGATAADAGTYSLRVQGGDCVSDPGTTDAVVNENPPAVISNLGTDDFCSTGTTTLQVTQYTGYSYEWRDGSNAVVSTTNTYDASATGTYTLQLTNNTTNCVSTSEPYTVTAVDPPTSSFTAASEVCVDVSLDFSATSTGQSGYTLSYSWDFGDGTTGVPGADTTHSYTAAGTNNVMLTTGYANVDACTTTSNQSITVSSAPTATDIEALVTPGATERVKCPEDTLTVSLPSGYDAVWTVNGNVISDTLEADAWTPPNVSSVTLMADVVTDIGCSVTGVAVQVDNYANSQVIISSSDAQIVDDTISLEEGISSVTLEVTNGSDYTWAPANILSSTTESIVTAVPVSKFTTVTVTGTDQINGCITTDTVVLETPGVLPRNSFSPNNDGMGFDCWEILNTSTLEGCTVYIMDERGRYVLKVNSPFNLEGKNNCVWNGNIDNGSQPAPEGTYYFILKCKDDEFSQTGAILLAR